VQDGVAAMLLIVHLVPGHHDDPYCMYATLTDPKLSLLRPMQIIDTFAYATTSLILVVLLSVVHYTALLLPTVIPVA
jgi:hypothetical protein